MKQSAPLPRFNSRLLPLCIAALLAAALIAAPRGAGAQQPAPAPSSSAAPSANAGGSAADSDEQKEMDLFRHAPIVVKIGRLMGMDVETTAKVFEGINFAIIFLAVVIPLVRFMPRVLHKRSETLKQDIKTAREATADAGARLSAVEAQLAGLDEEIRKFRAQVEQESLEDEKRIKTAFEEESVRIVAAAEQEIAVAAAQARRGLRHFAADLAIQHAEKQLVLTQETDRALIAEFVAEVSGSGAGKGGTN